MKTVFLIAFYCVVVVSVKAQAPIWEWAKHCSDDGTNSYNESATVDSAGNIYALTVFKGLINVDALTFQSRGGKDILLIKYNKSGQVLWGKQIGGKKDDAGNGKVQSDKQGNVYITGQFRDTADFGGKLLISRDTFESDESLQGDGFIAKYTSQGNLIWVSQIGGKHEDEAEGLVLDGSAHLYVTGYFGEYQTLPPLYATATFDTITLAALGQQGIFLAKYDTSGKITWVKGAGHTYGGFGRTVALDNAGNIYMLGQFSNDRVFFDTLRLNWNTPGFGTVFLAKYDSSGHPLWAKGIGGERATYGSGLGIGTDGYAYITGSISSVSTSFGNNITLPGFTDIFNAFIAKVSPAGNIIWAKNAGIDKYDYNEGYGLALDKNSNVYITGYFEGKAYYPDTLTSYGANDVFVAKYDSSGSYIWATHGGGNGSDAGIDIICNDTGDILVTGYYSGSNGKFDNSILPASNGWDMFLAKLTVSSTGITDLLAHNANAKVYPNPSPGDFTISWDKAEFDRCFITNIIGNSIITFPVQKGSHKIEIIQSNLPNGLYIIELKGKNSTACAKLIIN